MEGSSWRRRGSDDRPENLRNPRLLETQALPSLEPGRKLLTANRSAINLPEPAGYWKVSADHCDRGPDGLTELDRVWLAARELVDEGLFVQASCYTPGRDIIEDKNRKYTTSLVYCYVENYLEIDRVAYSADQFRERVHYPYVMYFKTHQGIRESVIKYLYCLDRNLYENIGNGGFKLLRFSAYVHSADKSDHVDEHTLSSLLKFV